MYTVESAGVTVTSTNPVYSNQNYYYMGYMFDNVFDSVDAHTNYWLGQTRDDTVFTFDFDPPVDLTRIRLAPKCRSDSVAVDFQVSAVGESGPMPVSNRIHQPDTAIAVFYEFPINMEVSQLTVSISLAGGGNYMSFNEFKLYQADAEAAEQGKPARPQAWSDMTPTNMPFDRGALPRDDAPSPFICEKRVP